jgi:hypothetical protein
MMHDSSIHPLREFRDQFPTLRRWTLPMPETPDRKEIDRTLDTLARLIIDRESDRVKSILNEVSKKLHERGRYVRIVPRHSPQVHRPPTFLEELDARIQKITEEQEIFWWSKRKINQEKTLLESAIEVKKRQALTRSPWAVVVQQPVGHGGFHTGVLGVDEPSLRWVYDCGSWRKKGREALASRIADYGGRTRGRQIDLLFVSHFDADHVWGLDELLRQHRVDTVFIPYLEPEDATAIQVAASIDRRWSAELAEVVSDPISWFRGRGAVRVVAVRPGARPDGFAMPFGPGDEARGEVVEGELEPRLIGPNGRVLPWWPPSASTSTTWNAEPGTAVAVVSRQRAWTDWWFLPHVHGVSRDVRSALRIAALQAMQDLAGSSGSASANDLRAFNAGLAELLKDRRNRTKLREIFLREGLTDANAISMSLYLGPRDNETRSVHPGAGARAGWLLTGDAKLGNKARREEWRSAFSALSTKRTIGTLMLPHHGSYANFHDELLSFAPEARLFVTVDNSDLNIRPHPDVRASLDRSYHQVSEKKNTVLQEISGPIEFSDGAFVRTPQGWI